MMFTLSEISKVREVVTEWKKQGFSVGLVPTMGALHIGHASLIEKAKKTCDKVVVSVFVNPTQFGPSEDYDKYPRTLESDQRLCESFGVDVIFAPTPLEMYPSLSEQDKSDCTSERMQKKFLTSVVPPLSFVDKLCGKSRVGHFNGVATVVLKLFNIVQPDKAFFGQKDAQQVIVLKKMCDDFNIPVEIVSCPIIRDLDGLAFSSRNTYLSDEGRVKALTLSLVLNKIKEMYELGETSISKLIVSSLPLLHKDVELEYLEARDIKNLEMVSNLNKNILLAIAAKVEGVRLIDNIIF